MYIINNYYKVSICKVWFLNSVEHSTNNHIFIGMRNKLCIFSQKKNMFKTPKILSNISILSSKIFFVKDFFHITYLWANNMLYFLKMLFIDVLFLNLIDYQVRDHILIINHKKLNLHNHKKFIMVHKQLLIFNTSNICFHVKSFY